MYGVGDEVENLFVGPVYNDAVHILFHRHNIADRSLCELYCRLKHVALFFVNNALFLSGFDNLGKLILCYGRLRVLWCKEFRRLLRNNVEESRNRR